MYMHALASLRNGPIVILSEKLGSSTQFVPLENMRTTIRGPHSPTTAEPRLPPIYLLNRTSTEPPHFNATKQTDQRPQLKQANLNNNGHMTGGDKADGAGRQSDINRTHPPAIKRPRAQPRELVESWGIGNSLDTGRTTKTRSTTKPANIPEDSTIHH
jgi:hypothetical protein